MHHIFISYDRSKVEFRMIGADNFLLKLDSFCTFLSLVAVGVKVGLRQENL